MPLACLAVLILGPAAGRTDVAWLQSIDDRQPWQLALDLAQSKRRPVMAFVYMRNSQLTDMMDGQTFTSKDVSEASKRFQCVRVEAFRPENRAFIDRYQLRGAGKVRIGDENGQMEGRTFPVTVFISPTGEPEHMVYGFAIPQDFALMMNQVLEVVQLREALAKQADDAKSLARLGELYVALQRYEAARGILEQALKLDPDGKVSAGPGVRLDLAVAVLDAGEYDRASALIAEAIARFPGSELDCKAHYLLGGALLATAEASQQQADRLAAQMDDRGAAQAREAAQLARRQAEEAWRWFEAAPGRRAPCADTEWSANALGCLADLRLEIGFQVAQEVVRRGDPKVAVKVLRDFVGQADAEYADRVKKQPPGQKPLEEPACLMDALLLIGKQLMAAKDYGGALDHWRRFLDRYPTQPKGNPPRVTLDPEASCEATFLMGECLFRLGKRSEALNLWRRLADAEDRKNPCPYTPSAGPAAAAVQDPDGTAKWLEDKAALRAALRAGKDLVAAGKYDEAMTFWGQLLDRFPLTLTGNPPTVTPDPQISCEASFLLGECLFRLGKRDEALAQWQKLAEADKKKNPCYFAPAREKSAAALQDPEGTLKRLTGK